MCKLQITQIYKKIMTFFLKFLWLTYTANLKTLSFDRLLSWIIRSNESFY